MGDILTEPDAISQIDGDEHGAMAPWSWRLRLTLLAGLLGAAAVVAGVATYSMRQKSLAAHQHEVLGFNGLDSASRKSLDRRYQDKNSDLIADPPTTPAQRLNPDTLILGHFLGDDEGLLRVDWEGLQKKIAQATGKEVVLQAYLHTPDEIAAVRDGKIHLVAAHSAEIPSLVNSAGLVPFAELGTAEAPDGNRLLIAAGSESNITSLDQLRDRTLICTKPGSVTGYRAAIVAIHSETGLTPGIDYRIYFSHKHERSIRGLEIGKFPFVAISHDVLDRMTKEGQIKPSGFRVIYQSEPIPRLTVGYIHRLDPAVGKAVTSAVLEFENDGTAAEGEASFRFVPIDYKRDYEFARRLDDAFDARFGQDFLPDMNGP